MGVIVVGVDGSDNSIAALDWAIERARADGSTVRVVHTWEYPYVDTSAPMVGAFAPSFSELQTAAEAHLDDALTRAHTTGAHLERLVVEGSPATTLIDLAKDADLLVVGARGHGGFTGLLVGSVATKVVNHATVPVAVIRR